MALTVVEGTLAFSSTTTVITVGPETALSLFQFAINQTPMGAGDNVNVSVQRKDSGGTMYEVDNYTLSPPVAIPAAPGQGYVPLEDGRWYANPYGGLQFVCTYTLASGNTTYPSLYYDLTQGF